MKSKVEGKLFNEKVMITVNFEKAQCGVAKSSSVNRDEMKGAFLEHAHDLG